jgi:hypothetical protein
MRFGRRRSYAIGPATRGTRQPALSSRRPPRAARAPQKPSPDHEQVLVLKYIYQQRSVGVLSESRYRAVTAAGVEGQGGGGHEHPKQELLG